jgi:hypothetical protein
MKLRNKKTGEIADLEHRGLLKSDNNNHIIVYPEGTLKYYAYNSLAELNEEWEDYEEPKEYWYMDYGGRIKAMNDANDEEDVARKAIGNYFETKEEAELAVRKLKAWKRLKDKGFKVDLWDYDGSDGQGRIRTGRILFRVKDYEENDKDLDLLFGGEE